MIVFDSRSIQDVIAKIKTEYSHISGDTLNTAISNALNRTAAMTRTAANKQIRVIYNISAAKINSEIKISYSQARTLTSKLRVSGEPLSMNNFQAKQVGDRGTTSFSRNGSASSRLTRKSRNKAAKGVSFMVKKGQAENLPTAFIQTANGGITVFARGKYKSKGEGFEFGKERLPIAKITTTSIPLMFANAEVIQPVENEAERILGGRIEHEINWLLSK